MLKVEGLTLWVNSVAVATVTLCLGILVDFFFKDVDNDWEVESCGYELLCEDPVLQLYATYC